MSASRVWTLVWTPRWSSLVVSSANQRSTWLSQDELVWAVPDLVDTRS
jgi:hypothetical protein